MTMLKFVIALSCLGMSDFVHVFCKTFGLFMKRFYENFEVTNLPAFLNIYSVKHFGKYKIVRETFVEKGIMYHF